MDGNLIFVNRAFLRQWARRPRRCHRTPRLGVLGNGGPGRAGHRGARRARRLGRRNGGEEEERGDLPRPALGDHRQEPCRQPRRHDGLLRRPLGAPARGGEDRHATRLYALLSQINQAVVRTRGRDELFGEVCSVAVEFGGFAMAWIGLLDRASRGAWSRSPAPGGTRGTWVARYARWTDPPGQGPPAPRCGKGGVVICNDIRSDPRMLPWRDEALARGYRSSAAIPLRRAGRVIGALSLYAGEPGFFTEDERKLLKEIGVDISFALDALEAARERSRAEVDLAAAKERLDFMMDNSPAVIYTSGPRATTARPSSLRTSSSNSATGPASSPRSRASGPAASTPRTRRGSSPASAASSRRARTFTSTASGTGTDRGGGCATNSGSSGRDGRPGRDSRLLVRHHRAQARRGGAPRAGAPAAARPEAREPGRAGRRHRPRLQQPADGDPRQRRAGAR